MTTPPHPSMNVQPSYDSLWQKRLKALGAVWPEFLAGETEALHKARVASRRIREALPVVGANAPRAKIKKLRKQLRSLTRSLGPIRELDVELGMLEEQGAQDDVSRSALSLVRREVAARRLALRDRLGEEPPVADVKKLIKKLERVAETKDKGRKARSHEQADHEQAWRAALGLALLRRAKRLKSTLDEAGPLYAPDRIHDVRIAAKKLRYALEIAQDAGDTRARTIAKRLKREQQRLGRLHDLEALLKHVREAEASPRVGARLADLTAFADALERDCRQVHAEFVEHRDVMFECATDVRHQLVPAFSIARFHQARAGARPKRRPAKRA